MSPAPGNCRGHALRHYFHSDLKQCLPFVYSGCRGNRNNFLSESDCLSACGREPTIEQITQEGILSCTFGNETIPIGGKLGGMSVPESCGEPICQCITPPSLTCIQTQCPPPPPVETTPPCPIPNCGPHCTTATRLDNGCPTCDCEGGGQEGFETEFISVPDQPYKTKNVKG